MAKAYIALGANLGSPATQLRMALNELSRTPNVRLCAQSSFYRSAPVGLPGQADYCNAACEVETALSAPQLFDIMIGVERLAGRIRDGHRWGPRVLDLDLLCYENLRLTTSQLILPHPEMARRNFVLIPLAEIAPGLDIPGLGKVQDLAAAIGRIGLERWH